MDTVWVGQPHSWVKKKYTREKGEMLWKEEHTKEGNRTFYIRALYLIAKKKKIVRYEGESEKELLARIRRTYLSELGYRYPAKTCTGRLFTEGMKQEAQKLAEEVLPYILEEPPKKKITAPEETLDRLLDTLFPNEFKLNVFTRVKIGKKIPDFLHNEYLLVLEVFGDYWHGPLITGRYKQDEEDLKIDYYKSHGYTTIIVWERELNDLYQVVRKVRAGLGMFREMPPTNF